MSSNLVSSLASIKRDIDRKKIFRSVAFSLPANLPKENLNKVSKDLSKKIVIEKVEIEKNVEVKRKEIQQYTSALRDKKRMVTQLEERLEKMNKKDVEGDVSKSFDKIMKHLPIEHIQFVEPAVTIFTTSIFKKNNKIMGAYRIWIDWAYKRHSDAIRVVNIHNEAGSHPHPCIGSSANLCEGNATNELKKYYDSKNIYDLVEALIAFLLSDNVTSGYITSWNRWFEQLHDVDPDTVFSRRSIRPKLI